MNKLDRSDVNKYLQFGNLTKPFLKKEYIEEMVLRDYNFRKSEEKTIFESLAKWINHELRFAKTVAEKNCKFSRTAKEIWESGFTTGCTDMGLVFATMARQLGYPTTLLHTAEENWIKRLQAGEDSKMHYGHTFCEVFFNDKWILVDPTAKKILYDYNTTKIQLPYDLGGNCIFIPYKRCIDFEKPQTVVAHNELMDKFCKDIDLNK